MNWRHRILATGVLVLALGLGAATAQEDSLLQRYDLAIENLAIAVDSVPGDGVQARDELERALNALLTLSRDSTSVNLVQAMERTFARARTAVENQSRADIAVQAAVLSGGFRRLVMDSAFTAAEADDLELARTRLAHLGNAMTFGAESAGAAAAATDARSLRLAFEAGVADAIAAQLQVAQRLLAEDREGGYTALARAYGDSLLIQDSPRTDANLNQHLVGAAQAVVNLDDDALAAGLEGADLALVRLASAARSGLDSVEGGAAIPAASAPSDLPSVAPETAEATPATTAEMPAEAADQASDEAVGIASPPASEAEVGPAVTAPADAGDGVPAESAETTDEAVLDDPVLVAAVERALAQARAQERDDAIAEWADTLTSAGVAAAVAERQAADLVDAGYGSVADVTSALAAGVGRAVAALRVGDTTAAELHVADVAATYRGSLASLVQARDADVADETETLLASLADRPALREQDVTLLAAQLDAIDRAVSGTAQDSGLVFERAVDGVWSNWTRLGVLIVLGVLAIVQLVLLNMAFGGGNRNWRLVGWALLLLVVPVFYEALAALGSILADLLAMPGLEVLSRWSMFRSTTGQVVWALLVFIGLLLATIGLRGICVQFGLLGRGRRSTTATATATGTAVDATGATSATAVDWDEEF
ncbi:MAG: hypothetical protein R6W77_05640 [Trueperaceae bacterium]